MTFYIPAWKQAKRRESLERRVAYWEERVKEDTSLQGQLEYAQEQLKRFNAVYDRSDYDRRKGSSA